MFEWNPQLDTGIEEIDQQHRKLVGMLARLFDAMHTGAGKSVLAEILTGLETYAEQHFAVEEQFMRDCDYPEFEAHRTAHMVFRRKVATLREQFEKSGQGVLSIQVVLFLRNWLTDHIGSIDQALSSFLQLGSAAPSYGKQR